jgi:CarD family transcriptional regulator
VIGVQSEQHPKESDRDMNSENGAAELESTPMLTGAHSTPAAANLNAKSPSDFKAADFVVYPAHGAGQLLLIEEQIVGGVKLELFVIYFAKSKMTLRVPVCKAASVGMRKLSDPSIVETAKGILLAAPRKNRGNWPRLAQEYQSKLNSGDILAIAEVARDLFRLAESEQSFSERQLYASALDRLCGEVALVDGILTEDAVKEVEVLLKTGKLKRSA